MMVVDPANIGLVQIALNKAYAAIRAEQQLVREEVSFTDFDSLLDEVNRAIVLLDSMPVK